MTRSRSLLVGVCLVLLLSMLSPAHAGAAQKQRWGITAAPSTSYLYTTARGLEVCGAHAPLWMQELGLSGVTRMRTRYELRGYYDTGLPGLAYQVTPWYRTSPFPDDHRSLWTGRVLYLSPNSLRFYAGGQYSLRAKMVWERPSFWHPDIVRAATLGHVGCEHTQPGGA